MNPALSSGIKLPDHAARSFFGKALPTVDLAHRDLEG
jgi:hypothetical protein